MSTNDNTRSALRAALKQEDAALTERLAAAPQTSPSAETSDDPADPAEASRRSVDAEAAAAAPAKVAKAKAAPAKVAAKAAKAVKKHAAATAPDASTADAVPSAAAKKKAAPKASPKAAPAAAPAAESGAATKKGNAKAAAADADAGKKDKPEKVVRDSFSLPTSEHARIKALRVELGKAGRIASKSEVLRAGLNLLGDRSTAEVTALLDALPPVVKGKRSKKH
jgi:hypothetical protein